MRKVLDFGYKKYTADQMSERIKTWDKQLNRGRAIQEYIHINEEVLNEKSKTLNYKLEFCLLVFIVCFTFLT